MFFYAPDDVGNSAPIKTLNSPEIKIIKVINVDGEKVTTLKADTEYTYVCNQNISEINDIRWAFWIDKKDKSFEKEYTIEVVANTDKEENTTDFFLSSKADADNQKKEENTQLLENNTILSATLTSETHKIGEVDKEVAVLKVKYSKWLDGEKIRMEVYKYNKKNKKGKPTRNGGKDAVCSRTVIAKPEVAEVYWMAADGEKLEETGYSEDIYLYIKTLGLKDKTLELNVFDEDMTPTPSEHPFGRGDGDDYVEWKNNKVKVEKRDLIRQFKVGNKNRYEKSRQDEEADEVISALMDFSRHRETVEEKKKKAEELELYIYIKNAEELKLALEKDKDKFGKLKLTSKEQVIDTFFAKTKKESVLADLPLGKNKKTKVDHYEKLDKGVIGQKITLVTECDNLEGKDIAIYIYEKKPLLEAEDTKLKVIQNDKEVEKICATVKDGYAVAEIELRPKTDADFKKWLEEMGAHKKPLERKDTKLWLEVLADGTPVTKKFLEDKPVKFISTNWHEPMDYPQLVKHNYSGTEKPKGSTFGKVRNSETKNHQGLDIFALPGTNLYAELDGKVVEKRLSASGGNIITIQVTNRQEATNRKLVSSYSLQYTSTGSKGEQEKGTGFSFDSKIYLRHYHLSKTDVKKGELIKAGQKIGESGVTGNADKTRAPHLHFEVLDTTGYPSGLSDRINPAYFVNLQPIQDTVQDDSVKYKYNIDGTKTKV
ncbi:M23 family metallopeptidase (plasmid) [Bernardetia sp. OM2101]|uniref:M23 family metallopeptidase n=1 Tax=Bernardetia sp. OM2101 TaxID=3344876 RepID=UPI0035CF0DDB